jgi:hypothetical protein
VSKSRNQVNRFFDAVDKLRSFESADDVADFFTGLGYRGQASNRSDCIVARFLRDCVGDADAAVSACIWDVNFRWQDENKRVSYIQSSIEKTPASNFIMRFDEKRYTHLLDDAPLAIVDEGTAETAPDSELVPT